MKQHQPSALAIAFFYWYCRPEFREEIEGDLLERFHTNVKRYNYSKANYLFIKDIMLLFRPSIAGNLNQLTYSHIMTTSKENRRLLSILLLAVSLLFIPLIAMNFTEEVNWKVGDFLVAGFLLGGTCLTLEFILRKTRAKALKLMLIAIVILSLLLVWAEMAVGIFGSPIAGS